MDTITLEDGTTITPNPPGYWWAELAVVVGPLATEASERALQAELDRQARFAREATA